MELPPFVESLAGSLLTFHQWLYEVSDGRIGANLMGRPMLLLRTTGRRTGLPRTAALLYVRDGDAFVVIASKGGAPQHPGWFHNCLLYTSPSPRDRTRSRMPSSA